MVTEVKWYVILFPVSVSNPIIYTHLSNQNGTNITQVVRAWLRLTTASCDRKTNSDNGKKEEVGIKVVWELRVNLETNNFFPNTPDCGEAVPVVNEQSGWCTREWVPVVELQNSRGKPHTTAAPHKHCLN